MLLVELEEDRERIARELPRTAQVEVGGTRGKRTPRPAEKLGADVPEHHQQRIGAHALRGGDCHVPDITDTGVGYESPIIGAPVSSHVGETGEDIHRGNLPTLRDAAL